MTRPVALLLGLLALLLAACAPAASPAPPVAPAGQPAEAPPAAGASAEKAAASAQRTTEARLAPIPAPAARPAQPAPGVQADSLAGAPRQAPTPAPGPSGSPELPIVQNLGRMIIYTTDLTLLVESVDAFPTQAANLALANGGYLAGVETKDEGGVPTVIVRLKVPPAKYEATMRGLRGLGLEVRSEKATTQDVTEEYSDVQTQLASLEATHAQLLELQKRATTVEETLKIQQEANKIKLQIDRLKGRATALERLSEFATITARAQDAAVVLQRDYVAQRSALRRAETNRANLELQLKRARTPEEEAALRDRLAEVQLEITRHQSRLAEIETRAGAARISLPTAEPAAATARPDDSLPEQYIQTRVALRRAEYDQAELTRALRAGRPGADPAALTRLILEVQRLQGQLKSIEERARQLNLALPSLSPDQEAVLAGIPGSGGPDLLASIRAAWEASLDFLSVGMGQLVGLVVFLWWAIPLVALVAYALRRRLPALPRPARGSTDTPVS